MKNQQVIWEGLGHPPEPARGYGSGTRKKKTGYAADPGTGPEGETCKSCKFKTKKPWTEGHYLKCLLMREHWTGGAGTDIKARSPACRYWEKNV